MARPKLTVNVARTRYRTEPKRIDREAFTMVRKGKRISVPRTVYTRPAKSIERKSFTYKREDIGAKGRGKKVLPKLKKGLMTNVAKSMGYERVSDIPHNKLDDFSRKLVNKYGARKAFGMIQAQVLYRKSQPRDKSRKKFLYMRNYMGNKYSKQLTPRKAISKWKGMTHKARTRAMPSRVLLH